MSAGMMKIMKKRAQSDNVKKNAMSLKNIMMRVAVTGRLWGRRLGFAFGIFLGLLSPISEAAPTVFLTSPPAGNTVQYLTPATFNVSANVTPSAGTTIAQVEFYQGATLIGTTTTSPHTIVQTSLPAGSYSFTAKATDSAGGVTTSAARNVTVNANNNPPTVSLVAPSNNAQYQAPANVTLLAGAHGIELNTPITQVEFLDGTTVIATVTAMPYTVVWANPPAGTHSLTARATDSDGAVTTSAARTITVMAAGAKLYYLHSDHLETPRLVTDETNKVVWRNMPLTEPFGVSVPEEDPDGDGNLFTMNLRFPGQYADKETNTNYNYFRDYEPQTGRYIQSDPIGLAGGINTYSYVNGNSLSYVDPEGLDAYVIASPLGGGAFSYFAFSTNASSPSLSGQFNAQTNNFNTLSPGSYNITPRPTLPSTPINQVLGRNSRAGYPTISNTSNWNTVLSPNGSTSTGCQVHPGRNGTAGGNSFCCMVTNQSAFTQLNQLFQQNYSNGGVTLIILPAPRAIPK